MAGKQAIAAFAAFFLLCPVSFAFIGSGDGYNLSMSSFGYGAFQDMAAGFNITFGLYDGPVGDDSGAGYILSIRNIFSESETDSDPPKVWLQGPLPDVEFTRSPSIFFSYNVTDHLEIVNCTLVIQKGGAPDMMLTNSTITRDAHQNFTAGLSNGFYNWSIMCTDNSTNKNIGESEKWNFTVSYNPSTIASGCSDECDLGERICRDGSVWVCGNFDNDGCSEWQLQYCEKGESCEEGYCTALPCVEDWVCSEWGVCDNELELRQCEDWNNCGTSYLKPPEIRGCAAEAEEEIPAALPPPEPPKYMPKEPSRALEVAKSTAKYGGIALGALTVLIAVVLGGSLFISKTSFFLKQTFSTEAVIMKMAERGIAEEKVRAYAAKKGFPEDDAVMMVRDFKINKLNAEIERISKDVGIDGHAPEEK